MKYILLIVVATVLGAIIGKFCGDAFFFALIGFIFSAFIVGEINVYQIDSIIKKSYRF